MCVCVCMCMWHVLAECVVCLCMCIQIKHNKPIKSITSSKHGLYTIHTYMHVYIMCALSVCVCVCEMHAHACAFLSQGATDMYLCQLQPFFQLVHCSLLFMSMENDASGHSQQFLLCLRMANDAFTSATLSAFPKCLLR